MPRSFELEVWACFDGLRVDAKKLSTSMANTTIEC